jgi:hypothetical protein
MMQPTFNTETKNAGAASAAACRLGSTGALEGSRVR